MSRVIKPPNQQGLNSANRLLWDKYALTYIWLVSATGYFQDCLRDDLASTFFILDY